MDKNQHTFTELNALTQRLDRSNRLARLQCILTGILVSCCGIAVVLMCIVMPKFTALTAQMETIMANLETVTAELAAADLETLVKDVDSLAATSEKSIEQTMEKLNAIDFETLNKAIENLADVIEPLAKFFNVFK